MELDLSSYSVVTVRPCPSKQTMCLLSSSKAGGKQKVVIGDCSGRVTAYEAKNGNVTKSFENKDLLNADIGGTGASTNLHGGSNMEADEDVSGASKITSMISSKLQGGGAAARDGGATFASNGGITSVTTGGSKNDKVFVSTRSTVLGMNKKGKAFFSLASNSSEDILQILVKGSNLWCRQSSGGFQKYVNGEEADFYQVADGVNWIEYDDLRCTGEGSYDALLGCQDRSIRVIREGSNISTLGVDVCVTSLGCMDKDSDAEASGDGKRVVFGTSSGDVAMLRIDGDGQGRQGWHVRAGEKSKVS